MEIAEYTAVLDREGLLLAQAAEEAGTDTKVPTCPGWQVRDLLRHTGTVHRWATRFVAEALPDFHPGRDEPALNGPELLDWFREGHRILVDTLWAAPPDVECWSFLPAPSPLAFWARRQAHETTVHRLDAQSALGGTPSPVDGGFAADGIGELLTGFHARSRSSVRTDRPRTLRVRVTDQPVSWTLRLSEGPPVAERDADGEVDCELSGPAARLYLALWNRVPFPQITGDASLAALWRETSAITWG
ncbi:maleylpyruvate isomerase family mycothiol-dependent enzyme [Streptomyces sp. NA04227]|uniref:maleylpyruvate isomerase family mycothiol-dependent enzyme n=1 Tax=Streptomyces sp. NA04227 TaxID=2742136 RepID=UPI0015900849|nr:maleylpyruvate isomerase family mycothiol-dependent enzyme [Streptomyces sp. NA04227]QKW05213.1 maleylpyruvate isomerase family mycothiol-dependent enzyme [Streptomyces sp. NA04227]